MIPRVVILFPPSIRMLHVHASKELVLPQQPHFIHLDYLTQLHHFLLKREHVVLTCWYKSKRTPLQATHYHKILRILLMRRLKLSCPVFVGKFFPVDQEPPPVLRLSNFCTYSSSNRIAAGNYDTHVSSSARYWSRFIFPGSSVCFTGMVPVDVYRTIPSVHLVLWRAGRAELKMASNRSVQRRFQSLFFRELRIHSCSEYM